MVKEVWCIIVGRVVYFWWQSGVMNVGKSDEGAFTT